RQEGSEERVRDLREDSLAQVLGLFAGEVERGAGEEVRRCRWQRRMPGTQRWVQQLAVIGTQQGPVGPIGRFERGEIAAERAAIPEDPQDAQGRPVELRGWTQDGIAGLDTDHALALTAG